MDLFLTGKKRVLEALYSRYRLPPRGGGLRPKQMMLIDWLALCSDCGLYSGHFTERTARMCFAYAKPTMAQEFADISKFMSMTVFDFMEALAHGTAPNRTNYCGLCYHANVVVAGLVPVQFELKTANRIGNFTGTITQ
jgi:hypothetical protein